MIEQAEKFEEKLEGFNLELFTIPDESAFIPGENFKEEVEEVEEDKKKPEIKEEKEEKVEEVVEETTETEEEEEETTEEVELSEIGKTMSSLLEKGILLLPDDYEYEDTEEGLQKAFEDSENFRNQLAFQEAVKYLTSKEGLDAFKIEKSIKKIESYQNMDTETLKVDEKLEVIREFYKSKEYEDADIDSLIEDLAENDTKLAKELGIAVKYLEKEEKKRIEVETKNAADKKVAQEKAYKESQNILKNKLQTTSDYNGYVINDANKDRIFNAIYKPIKLDDGNITTEFNNKLTEVLNDPDKVLVLADLLLNSTEKGFDFSKMQKKAETIATKNIKKSIRDFKNTNVKNKTNGKSGQSQSDFDLSKASLGFKY